MWEQAKSRLQRLGRLAKVTLAALALYGLLAWTEPSSAVTIVAQLLVVACCFWLAARAARAGVRKVIWGLRNRLLVSYLFIAVVPVLLIATLALLTAWGTGSQITLFLATSELERRVGALSFANQALAKAKPAEWKDVMQGMGLGYYDTEFPGVGFIARNAGRIVKWPPGQSAEAPSEKWANASASGLVLRDDTPYLWAHTVKDGADFSAFAPLTPKFLGSLVPGVVVSTIEVVHDAAGRVAGNSGEGILVDGQKLRLKRAPPDAFQAKLPPPVNRFDIDLGWILPIPAANWYSPDANRSLLLSVHTRPSVLLKILTSQQGGEEKFFLPIALLVVAVLFLIVELVALVIGISLTRTITRAVFDLYGGTQKVIEGDFSHRIPVQRNDQLGELTTSFNVMTGNVERLLAVAKEKERMESELEIAREVQNQLYPRIVPALKKLRLTALCKPARTVSGDYYDYLNIDENRIALSIGDVAGKGISAALLMATLQSSIRAQMRSAIEFAAAAHGAPRPCISTARFVSELNRHVHAFTSPEKYSTFCFGVYDDLTGVLSYTNAGHLPPILIRDGTSTALDVNGMVVGAFPFAKYEESSLQLLSGDLLLCYTDGITEPENAYGEMFGEERLVDLVAKNSGGDDAKLIDLVVEAVEQWYGSNEQFDDMTILLARKQ